MKVLNATLAVGLVLATVGCQQDAQSPSENEPTPALAATQNLTFIVVSTGEFHSCGVASDNRAYCWGHNFYGGLGDGTTTKRSRPTLVAGGLRFSSVSAGAGYTCGLTTQQKAYCWGWNGAGNLGDGTTIEHHTPVAVKGGLVFRQIRPGTRHTCGATTDNLGYCWGSNLDGRLGIGSEVANRLTPTRIAGSQRYLRVIAGGSHSCGLTTTNKAYCWGGGWSGQVGDGKTFLRFSPSAVLGGLSFKQVVPGYAHTCGVTLSNRAYCWGYNKFGRLGDGTTTDRLVPTPVHQTAVGQFYIGVSPSGSHTCGVTPEHRMLCWGLNNYGQIGLDPSVAYRRLTPVQVKGTANYSAVAGGVADVHSCGLTASGAAYCWGANYYGQLGDGTTNPHYIPAPVAAP